MNNAYSSNNESPLDQTFNFLNEKHPRPLITVDNVIIAEDQNKLNILLIQRRNEPFSNCWALPGGFILKNESPFLAAYRKLKSETNLTQIPLFLIGVFGEPYRDPRGWVISLAFSAIVKKVTLYLLLEMMQKKLVGLS